MIGPSHADESMMIRSAVSTQYRSVTDRRTDERTELLCQDRATIMLKQNWGRHVRVWPRPSRSVCFQRI